MAQFIGIAFPFKKGLTAFPESATDNDLIKQSLIQLILTGRGERIMRPDVGSGAYAYVFENNDVALEARIQSDITAVITKYEPRVALTDIVVTRGDQTIEAEATQITITVNYVVLATKSNGTTEITIDTVGGGL